jgi:hypothetical protein
VRRTTLGVLIILIAAGAVALAAFSRLHHDLAIDEPFTALAAAHPASLGATLVHDNTPLYYVLLIAWTRLFGASAFALRALSLAAFGGAIAFSAAAARCVASARAAGLTALLVGCSVTFGLEPAATARPYALATLLSAITLWAALRVNGIAGARAAVPLAASHLLGLFTHPVFIFVSAASAIAGLVAGRRRLLLFAAPAAAIAIYTAAWWPMISRTAALPARSWMTPPALADLTAGTLFWGDHATPILAVLLIALFAFGRRSSLRDRSPALGFALTIAVLVLIATFAVSQVTPMYLAARTPGFVLPAVALAFGVAIAELGPAAVGMAAGVLVVVSAVRHTALTSQRPDPFPTRASLAAVADRAACGDTIVAAGLSYAPLVYYAGAAGLKPCVRLTAFPDAVREHPGWLDLSDDAATAGASTAATEAARLPPTGTVWVFLSARGIGSQEGAALARELTTRRRDEGRLRLAGSFFDEVRVFRTSDRGPLHP